MSFCSCSRFFFACLQPKEPALDTKQIYFTPSSTHSFATSFQRGVLYRGTITTDQGFFPCTTFFANQKAPLKMDQSYLLKGSLKKTAANTFSFRSKESTPLEKKNFLAKYRFELQKTFKTFLKNQIHDPKVLSLFLSLLSGSQVDRSLRFDFERLGLQHLLAISGFHFALLLQFFLFLFRLFLPNRFQFFALFLSLSFYLFFIGPAVAAQRSYLMALCLLFAQRKNYSSLGINFLGLALLIQIILNPFIATSVGFQLSFLSCFAILFCRPSVLSFLDHIFPKEELHHLFLPSQIAYHILLFLKETLSIILSIYLFITPVLLFHFHQIPLLSFFYNLFIPLFLSLSIFLLLMGIFLFLFFPFLAKFFFFLAERWTEEILTLLHYPPLFLQDSFFFRLNSPLLALFCLFCLFSVFLLTNRSRLSRI